MQGIQTKQVTKRTLVHTNLFDLIKWFYFEHQDLIICTGYWLVCIGIAELIIRNYSQLVFNLNGINVTNQYINVLTKCNYINIAGLFFSYVFTWYTYNKKISNGTEEKGSVIVYFVIFMAMGIKGWLCFDNIVPCDEICQKALDRDVLNFYTLYFVTNIFNIGVFVCVVCAIVCGLLFLIVIGLSQVGIFIGALLKRVKINYIKELCLDRLKRDHT